MVKILKRKAKAFYMIKDKVHYIKSPKELADQINQVDADAQGITLKEYYKRQAIRTAQQSIKWIITEYCEWLGAVRGIGYYK